MKKIVFGAKSRGCWQPSFPVLLFRNLVYIQHITGSGRVFMSIRIECYINLLFTFSIARCKCICCLIKVVLNGACDSRVARGFCLTERSYTSSLISIFMIEIVSEWCITTPRNSKISKK